MSAEGNGRVFRRLVAALRAASAARVVLALLVPATALAQVDPVAVVQRYTEALNRGDVAAATAVFTDDAVREGGTGLCAPTPCVGKAAIRKEIERLVAAGSRGSTAVSTQVAGDTVTLRLEVRSGAIRAAGVERIVNVNTYEVRGDKIAALRVRNDTSDPQTATFVAFQQAQRQAQPPAQLPRTGAPPGLLPAALGAGAALLGLGLALRRPRRLE